MSTFNIALSGLSGASSALDITSNNIANADTNGYKSSQAEFGTVFSSGAVNLNTSTSGQGVQLVGSPQLFSQGDITDTSSPLDMAISGNGFFTVAGSSGYAYTRNGEFQEDQNGNVTTATGQYLQVYPPLATGGFNTGALQNLNLNTAQSAPEATTGGTVNINLPSNDTVPTATPFDPTNPDTYSESTSTTVYDSLGNSYPATFYYTQTATPGLWDVNMTVNGTQVGGTQTLQFNNAGTLTAPASGNLTFAGFTPTDGAAAMSMTFNYSDSTQYGQQFGVNAIQPNSPISNVRMDRVSDLTAAIRYATGSKSRPVYTPSPACQLPVTVRQTSSSSCSDGKPCPVTVTGVPTGACAGATLSRPT